MGEGMKILVNFYIRGLDRIGVTASRKSCAAKPPERGRHTVSKLRGAISMKITIVYTKK